MYFDSHAHLDDERFSLDRDQVIGDMANCGISLILNIGADLKSSQAVVDLSDRYDFMYAAVGVHPHDCKDMSEEGLEQLRDLTQKPKVQAVGEIGLDYYYDHSPRETQRYWFARQMDLAMEMGKPVVIHCRDAYGDCMDILQRYNISKNGGVMHCYSGSVEIAREVLKMGLHISFAGPVTYKNNIKTIEVVKETPMERLLIETDCPYLSPVPLRGQRNDSRNIIYVARKIAEIKDVSEEEIARITKQNGMRLFQISACADE